MWIALLVGLLGALAPACPPSGAGPLASPAGAARDRPRGRSRPHQPGLSNARLYPVTGAVLFLRGRPERVAGIGRRPPSRRRDGLWPLRRARRQPGQAPALRGGLRRHGHRPPGLLLSDPRLVEPLARPAGGALGGGGTARRSRRRASAGGSPTGDPTPRSTSAPERSPWRVWRGGEGAGERRGCRASGGSPGSPRPAAGWSSRRPGTPAGGPGSTAGRSRSSRSRAC